MTITPRNFEFKFKEVDNVKSHYAIIEMAFVSDNYPLYYDEINEKGQVLNLLEMLIIMKKKKVKIILHSLS